MPVSGDDTKAFCKYCKCEVKSKYQDLKQHAQSKKHQNSCPFTKTLDSYVKTDACNESNKLEGSVALYLCCHSAISSCDHLVDMCKNNITNSKTVSQMKMHRTKCTNVINNVLCKHFEAELKEDIGEGKFSLLIDESNDIAVLKMLGISIIYFSTSNKQIVSTYLGLEQLESCDAESIVNGIKSLLMSKQLDIKKLAAIGTDNASVMVGINGGVCAKLKNEVPSSLLLIRCVCSFIATCCIPRVGRKSAQEFGLSNF